MVTEWWFEASLLIPPLDVLKLYEDGIESDVSNATSVTTSSLPALQPHPAALHPALMKIFPYL